eukprot:gene32665-36877_t
MAEAKKKTVSADDGNPMQTLVNLWPYMWPADRFDLKMRVVWATVFLIISKFVLILVPYFFKWATDALDGRIDMAGDPQLERNDGRVQRTAEIDGAIQAWCDTLTIDEALAVLKAADVPAGKIYSVRDMMSDPQFIARGMFEQHQFADGTPVKLPAISPKLSETPGHTNWLGPALGQHNEEVLPTLGYKIGREQV